MSLKVYNSLTRQREAFRPLSPPRVGMYVCGPTVYGHSHLGHAKSYVSFDCILRWLRASGYEVNYVQNITDVGHLTDDADEGEDKVIAEARRRGLHPMAVVEIYMRSYYEDMDALNVLRPDIAPRATGHIPEQIEQIKALIGRGHAYEVNGNVYFDVTSFRDYGKLSGRRIDELEAGARVAVNPEKRHPADFALWKRAEPGHIMQWPSPWGWGYPGWHIECSVMSQKYLGETFDIHGGGIENKFPHHECEIAQAECATGKPFARYWLHNNMCTVNGQKMGKSLGNAISLKQIFREGHELLERTYEPVVVRHFILTSHYRATLDFSNPALQAAEKGCYKLRDTLRELSQQAPRAPEKPRSDQIRAALERFEQQFTDAMNEDFNTAAAIAAVFDITRQVEGWLTAEVGREDLLAADALLNRYVGDVLGLVWPAESAAERARVEALVQLLIDLRADARRQKNFALADTIRDRLTQLGIELRDTPQGTTYKL